RRSLADGLPEDPTRESRLSRGVETANVAVRSDSEDSHQRASQTMAAHTRTRHNFGIRPPARSGIRTLRDAATISAGAVQIAGAPTRNLAPRVLPGSEFERSCAGDEHLGGQCAPSLRTRQAADAFSTGSRRSRVWN